MSNLIILEAVVGSHAYGLEHADSDYDYLGIYITPTLDLVRYGQKPAETQVFTEPNDRTLHEVGKFANLAGGGNPTVLELLWLDKYEIKDYAAESLLDIRTAFLSRKIKDSYFGYAKQQFHKLQHHGSFSNAPDHRAEKNARHLLRLVNQGLGLWEQGIIVPRVTDPDALRDEAKYIVERGDEGIQYANFVLNNAKARFEQPTDLPEKPNDSEIRQYIDFVRRNHL